MPSKLTLVLAPSIYLAFTAAHAEVIDATANGFTLSNKIVVSTDAQTTYAALVNDIDRWWPRDHTWFGVGSKLSITAQAGGCFCERKGAQQAQHMTVSFVDPGKLLRMTGGLGPLQGMGIDGVLEFRMTELEQGGTQVTMHYRAGGYTPDDLSQFAPIVDQVQALQIGGLATFLNAAGAAAESD